MPTLTEKGVEIARHGSVSIVAAISSYIFRILNTSHELAFVEGVFLGAAFIAIIRTLLSLRRVMIENENILQ